MPLAYRTAPPTVSAAADKQAHNEIPTSAEMAGLAEQIGQNDPNADRFKAKPAKRRQSAKKQGRTTVKDSHDR